MTEMNETNPSTVLPGQERYVAPLDETPLKAVRYSCAAFAPVVKTWAIFDRMIIGERSLGTALRILASLAPSMSHDSITSHNAIW